MNQPEMPWLYDLLGQRNRLAEMVCKIGLQTIDRRRARKTNAKRKSVVNRKAVAA